MTERILPSKHVPAALWDGSLLHLPSELVAAYQQELAKNGQLAAAKGTTTNKDIHGGPTLEATLEHFTFRFAVSAGRPEYVLLDPMESLERIPDALLTTFSQGNVAVLDIPCGVATSALSLLVNLAFLRKSGVLAPLPLTVTVTGGDNSSHAITLAHSMLSGVNVFLASQGITVQWQMQSWDAFDAMSTAALIDSWFAHSMAATEFVVIVANFSGALVHTTKFDEFKPCFEAIAARLYDKKGTILWIEPGTNDAKKLISKWLPEFFKKRLPNLVKTYLNLDALSVAYKMKNPMNNSDMVTDVTVQRFVRN